MLFSWIGVVASILLLSFGGEALVRYAIRLGAAFRISPTVIGLTVVAFGTSAPELATAIIAAFNGHARLAVANVIGSNIANIGLILGLTAVFSPLIAERRFVRREILVLLGTAAALLACVGLGSINRFMALGLLLVLGWFLRMLLKGGKIEEEVAPPPKGSPWFAVFGTVLGLIFLVAGAHWLVVSASAIAENFGVSERVIGLTIVAFGTSVPELVASLVAAYKGETGLVLGNIVGSNIFNTLLILPSAILIQPVPIEPSAFGLDILVMVVFSGLLIIIFRGEHRLTRWEGSLMVLGYLGYLAVLGNQQIG